MENLVKKPGYLGDTFGVGGSGLNEARLFYETAAHNNTQYPGSFWDGCTELYEKIQKRTTQYQYNIVPHLTTLIPHLCYIWLEYTTQFPSKVVLWDGCTITILYHTHCTTLYYILLYSSAQSSALSRLFYETAILVLYYTTLVPHVLYCTTMY